MYMQIYDVLTAGLKFLLSLFAFSPYEVLGQQALLA